MPAIMNRVEQERFKVEIGERTFSAQYLQEPLPAGGTVFKLRVGQELCGGAAAAELSRRRPELRRCSQAGRHGRLHSLHRLGGWTRSRLSSS